MKKALLTMMVLTASVLAWAQTGSDITKKSNGGVGTLTFIPKAGLNFATTSLNAWAGKSAGISKPNVSVVVGPVFGVEAEYKTHPWLSFSAALLYSMQGRKYSDVDVREQAVKDGILPDAKDASIRKEYHHYFNIPITANFYVIEGLSVRTGLQFGYLFHQGGTFENPYDSAFPTHSISGSPAKFDVSIPVGVSYAMDNGLQLDLRYNHGLTNLSWSDGIIKEKNRVLQLTVGYRLDMQRITSFFKH